MMVSLAKRVEEAAALSSQNADDFRWVSSWIEQADDWDLFRVNPLRVARHRNLFAEAVVDFFIGATRVGLFDMHWNIVCPGCGGVEYSHAGIGALSAKTFHCTVCDVDIDRNLDDQVEVSFTVNQGVRNLKVNPYESFESHQRFFYSSNYTFSNELKNYWAKNFVRFIVVPPHKSQTIDLSGAEGQVFRLISLGLHQSVPFVTGDESTECSSHVDVVSDGKGLKASGGALAPNRQIISVANEGAQPLVLTLSTLDLPSLLDILSNHPHHVMPYLTAKQLLMSQLYRDLFNVHELPKDFNLNLRSLTLLFTDLKGSTALYEKTGDLSAFHIVQEHFRILRAAVRACSGSIVKTMGDAVMATFADPLSALQAALLMLSETADFWERHNVPLMGLKIGLHEGPALAVNDEGRIDYFGKTVNTAARVQGESRAGQITFSESIYKHAAIAEAIKANGCNIEVEQVRLKGIAEAIPLYRISF